MFCHFVWRYNEKDLTEIVLNIAVKPFFFHLREHDSFEKMHLNTKVSAPFCLMHIFLPGFIFIHQKMLA